MLKPSEYTKINKSTMIIHSNVAKPIDFNLFNKEISLDDGYGVQVIFSNYTDINLHIRFNGEYEHCYRTNWNPYFNHQVNISAGIIQITFNYNFDNLIILPDDSQLTHLTFGPIFNKPIQLPDSLTHLIFGYYYNQPVELPGSLIDLKFGFHFSHPINLANNSRLAQLTQLTHLTLGFYFSHPVDLPNIKYLSINCNNLYLIENLPDSLEILVLRQYFDLPLDNLPNSIKHIVLNGSYDLPISSIPLNLKLIECSHKYKYMDLLENYKLKSDKDFQIKLLKCSVYCNHLNIPKK